MTAKKTETAAVVVPEVGRFTDEQLSGITNINDALTALADAGIAVESVDDYGTGFVVADDKAPFVGAEMVALEWTFHDGDNGEFVSVTVLTRDGRRAILNDGGTGICQQLREITSRRRASGHRAPTKGVAFPRGLRASTYQRKDVDGELMVDPSGKPLMATTYYIA